MEAINQFQDWISLNVSGQFFREGIGRNEPAVMGPPKPLLRAVGIAWVIAKPMVIFVVGFPPTRPHLPRRGSNKTANPFHPGGSLVGFVGQETVVDGSGAEHSQPVPKHNPKDSPPTEACEKGDRHAEMTKNNPDWASGITEASQSRIVAGTGIRLWWCRGNRVKNVAVMRQNAFLTS